MVHADIYDEFVTKLGEAARNVKVGDPFNSETQNGPQVNFLFLYFFKLLPSIFAVFSFLTFELFSGGS